MNVVLVGSAGRCGIYEYCQILMEGFRQAGHRVKYVGVRNKDNRDLRRQLAQLEKDDQVVIVEYEPGIFDLRELVMGMARLRLRGKTVLLSVHEIGPAKYGEYHYILERLGQPARFRGPLELVRLVWVTAWVAYRYLTLRVFLVLLGWLPHRIVVHSARGAVEVRIATANHQKIHSVPLVIKPLEGDRDHLRDQLDLPRDVFAFIIPGFLFRRKRIVEVIRQLPEGVELWIVGTPSEYDPGYLEEIRAFLAESGKQDQVRLSQDYDRMEQYLLAADAAVLYYEDGYQSAVASLAVGAGMPCVFSDIPAFADLEEAGLVVRTSEELRQAMVGIQDADVYAGLVRQAESLRQRYSPPRIAAAYSEIGI